PSQASNDRVLSTMFMPLVRCANRAYAWISAPVGTALGYRGTRYVPAIRSGMPRDGFASATTIPARPSSQGSARIQGQVTSGSHNGSDIDQGAGWRDVGRNIRNGAHTIAARTRCRARPARLPFLVCSAMPLIRNIGPLNAHVRTSATTD